MTQSWHTTYETKQYAYICSLLKTSFEKKGIPLPKQPDETFIEKVLNDQPNRVAHIISAYNLAKELAPLLKNDRQFIKTFEQCVLLHDIGYATSLRTTGAHSIDGAAYVAHWGVSPQIVSAILFHTETATLAQVLYPADSTVNRLYRQIQNYIPTVFDQALTAVDLHTSPTGERISIKQRLNEINVRFKGTPTADFMQSHYDSFRQSRAQLIALGGSRVAALLPE